MRTSGSYKQQHARHLAQVAAKVGTAHDDTAAMGTYDSQWQTVGEVSGRLSGLFEGFALRWPASEPRAPLLVFSGSSSCASGKKYSVYMGKETRHNHFHNMPNASSLIPYARRRHKSFGAVYIDTNGVQLTFASAILAAVITTCPSASCPKRSCRLRWVHSPARPRMNP